MRYNRMEDARFKIKMPYIKQQRGLGDVAASAINKFGIKPCSPCLRRKQWLNQHFSFVPAQAEKKYLK